MLVTIHNVTPENNSVINSIRIYKPAGATATFRVVVGPINRRVPDNGNLKITGFDGLKWQQEPAYALDGNLNVRERKNGRVRLHSCLGSRRSPRGTSGHNVPAGQRRRQQHQQRPANVQLLHVDGVARYGERGDHNKPVTVTLTNTSALGGPSISGLTVSASTSGVTATVPAISPPLAPGDPPRSLIVLISAPCGATGGNWTSAATGGTFSGTTAAPSYGVNPCTIAFNPDRHRPWATTSPSPQTSPSRLRMAI